MTRAPANPVPAPAVRPQTVPADPAPVSIGGYRLVRTLGAGPRATVFLGHAEGHPPVAVKVFAAAVPAERIEREAETLMRAAGDHVLRLDDLALDDRGRPAFLLERIAGPSLGALLDRRGAIRPGEAVTILAPIAGALARMHRSGVAHGGLDRTSVLFTEAGSPTIVGFGDAELLDLTATGRARVTQRSERIARDSAALRRLVLTVLEGTVLDFAAEREAAQILRELPEGESHAERLADAVFGLADPEPVDLHAAGSSSVPPGLLTGTPAPTDRPPTGSPLLLDAFQVPDWLRSVLGGRLGGLVGGLQAAAGSMRRPFWVAGGVGAAALVAALLLVPSDPPAGSTSVGEVSEDRDATPPAVTSPTADRQASAVQGEDPAAAARALLDSRADCFRELSVLCLDAVDQPDSSASLSDTAAILAAQEAGGIAAAGVVLGGEVEIVERLGDTVLVRVSGPDAEPTSVLLMRTEAGWRIRGFPGAAGN